MFTDWKVFGLTICRENNSSNPHLPIIYLLKRKNLLRNIIHSEYSPKIKTGKSLDEIEHKKNNTIFCKKSEL